MKPITVDDVATCNNNIIIYDQMCLERGFTDVCLRQLYHKIAEDWIDSGKIFRDTNGELQVIAGVPMEEDHEGF